MYDYGGIWIDINTIVLKNLKIYTDKLIQYDFIGFGCKAPYCENGIFYSRPDNKFLGSRKNSIYVKQNLEEFKKLLNKTNVNEDQIINTYWTSLNNLVKNKYEYYHIEPKKLGYYDKDYTEITLKDLYSNIILDRENLDIDLININFTKNNKIINYDRDTFIIRMFFRMSMFPEHPYPDLPVLHINNVDVYVLYIPKREMYIKGLINKLFVNPIFFKGYNKNDLNEEELIKNEYIDREWTTSPKFNFGRVACHMGHMAILKSFLSTDQKYALIFEDDIHLDLSKLHSIRSKIKKILTNIPNDAQIVYLSFCWEHCDKLQKYDSEEIFLKSYRPLCRHMYLVSQEGARIILNNTKLLKAPGDNTIASLILNNKLISYSINPEYFIIEQNRQTLGSNLGNRMFRVCK